jgi:hypothetical protein
MKTIPGYIALCTAVLLLGFPTRAEAYLDPGTGSIVLQVVMGGMLAVLATTRLYWKRIRLLLRRDRKSQEGFPSSIDR